MWVDFKLLFRHRKTDIVLSMLQNWLLKFEVCHGNKTVDVDDTTNKIWNKI